MALWACTHEDANGTRTTVFHEGDGCTDGNENTSCGLAGMTLVECLRRAFALGEGDHVIAIDPAQFAEQKQRK